jgi:hypothetical protein
MPAPGEAMPGCIFAPRCPQVRAICRQGQPPVVALGKREVACVLAKDGVA